MTCNRSPPDAPNVTWRAWPRRRLGSHRRPRECYVSTCPGPGNLWEFDRTTGPKLNNLRHATTSTPQWGKRSGLEPRQRRRQALWEGAGGNEPVMAGVLCPLAALGRTSRRDLGYVALVNQGLGDELAHLGLQLRLPRLSHPDLAHAIPSSAVITPVYRRQNPRFFTILRVKLIDQQRPAQAPSAWPKLTGSDSSM